MSTKAHKQPLFVAFMALNLAFEGATALITLKGTVSPDFKVFFIIYDIKSVLSVWTLMVLNF